MRADYVILGSVLSEKAVGLADAKVYTLRVAAKATKADVKRSLKQVFGVDAVEINTVITAGKEKRKMRAKGKGPVQVRMPKTKKAYVKLKQGQELPAPVLALPETGAEAGASAAE